MTTNDGYKITRLALTIIAVIAVAGILGIALGGCGDPATPPRPVVCATYQAPDGTWMEEDNEAVDDDPCDLDDAYELDSYDLRKKKPMPAKTSAPIGGKKKRF